MRFKAVHAVSLLLAISSSAAAELPEQLLPMRRHEALRVELTRALDTDAKAAQREHPLAPLLRYAHQQHGKMAAQVRDYRCQLIKRERIGSRLQDYQAMEMKVRNHGTSAAGAQVPFSVYLKFAYPAGIKGREALYVAGANQGELLATKGGGGLLRQVTRSLSPSSPEAMQGTRYPITDVGMLNLVERLIEEGIQHVAIDWRRECQVIRSDQGQINNRPCHVFQVTFPRQREGTRFYRAQIYVDRELGVPVRYAAYSWPTSAAGQGELLEEFTYLDVELNAELTDRDFDRENTSYGFYLPEQP